VLLEALKGVAPLLLLKPVLFSDWSHSRDGRGSVHSGCAGLPKTVESLILYLLMHGY
jgi:hypothetical protein